MKWGTTQQRVDINPWYALIDVVPFLAAVAFGRWNWYSDSRFKYITIRLDTRTGRFILFDRDGNKCKMSDLMRQVDDYEEPLKLVEFGTGKELL